MIRATKVIGAGRWSGVATDAVLFGYEDRHRRRLAMQGERGLVFLLDLPEAAVLNHGDGLVLEDGRVVEVRAKPEPLLVVTARDAHHLARLAWHLGNRHVPAAIEAHRILIRADHVIAEMLAGLGADVAAIEAPFDPEGGAYAGHAGSHDGGHRHGAAQGQGHGHA
ncbi:MAG: urease accessory protein UreE [Propylenella sp.]